MIKKLKQMLFFLMISFSSMMIYSGDEGSLIDDQITKISKEEFLKKYPQLKIEQPQATCPNAMGCQLAYASQQIYKKELAQNDIKLSKIAEINNPFLADQVYCLAKSIPYLGKDASRKIIDPTTNSKGESVVLFSKNPWYALAMVALRPFNNQQGYIVADALAKKGKSLALVERYDILVKKRCIQWSDEQQQDVMTCGFSKKYKKRNQHPTKGDSHDVK